MDWERDFSPGQRGKRRSPAQTGRKGYEAQHALRSDGWHLLRNGEKLQTKDGQVTFTCQEAIAFLQKMPEQT